VPTYNLPSLRLRDAVDGCTAAPPNPRAREVAICGGRCV